MAAAAVPTATRTAGDARALSRPGDASLSLPENVSLPEATATADERLASALKHLEVHRAQARAERAADVGPAAPPTPYQVSASADELLAVLQQQELQLGERPQRRKANLQLY